MAKPTVIRKKIQDFDSLSIEPSPIDGIYPPMPDEYNEKPKVIIAMTYTLSVLLIIIFFVGD